MINNQSSLLRDCVGVAQVEGMVVVRESLPHLSWRYESTRCGLKIHNPSLSECGDGAVQEVGGVGGLMRVVVSGGGKGLPEEGLSDASFDTPYC